MIVLDYEINWGADYSIAYSFLTAVTSSKKLSEQRKPLLVEMKRTQDFSIDLFTNDTRLFHMIATMQATPAYVPIYSEALLPSGIGNLQGLSIVNVNDFGAYYNTIHASKFMLIDTTREKPGEIVTKSSFPSNTQINFAEQIVGLFPVTKTVIYPVMYGILETKKIKSITDTITRFTMSFREYF
ncbi:MAG TPA: hypothetical protein PLY62_08645 [Bacteroidales bacterium]|nr:hypothetical protein [Bacteroidales bacterium]